MFNLPEMPGPARDACILDHLRQGDVAARWVPVSSSTPDGHTAVFQIMGDALGIPDDNGVPVRVTVSAILEQIIADMLGASLLTAKLMDLLYAARDLTLFPHPQLADATMVRTSVAVTQSRWIDSQITALGQGNPSQVPQTVGKQWVIDNLLVANPAARGKAINYGWHFPDLFRGTKWDASVTSPEVRVVQGRGWAHGPQEVDYSQNCILVQRGCVVDGAPRDLRDVLQDPTIARLANADGVLRVLRQPGAPPAPLLASA